MFEFSCQQAPHSKEREKNKKHLFGVLVPQLNQQFGETLEAVVGPVTLIGSQSENLMGNSVNTLVGHVTVGLWELDERVERMWSQSSG